MWKNGLFLYTVRDCCFCRQVYDLVRKMFVNSLNSSRCQQSFKSTHTVVVKLGSSFVSLNSSFVMWSSFFFVSGLGQGVFVSVSLATANYFLFLMIYFNYYVLFSAEEIRRVSRLFRGVFGQDSYA